MTFKSPLISFVNLRHIDKGLISFIGFYLIFLITPLIYSTDVLWGRLGDVRLVIFYCAFLILSFALAVPIFFSFPCVVLIYYICLTINGANNNLISLGSTQILEILSVPMLFFFGIFYSNKFIYKNIAKNVLLISLCIYSVVIVKYSVNSNFSIVGMNNRNDMVNFNYIFVANSLVIIFLYYLLLTGSDICIKKVPIISGVLFALLFCGSRFAVYIFLSILLFFFARSLSKGLTSEKIICVSFVVVFAASLFLSINFFSNRYSVNTEDQSFQIRKSIFIADLGYVNKSGALISPIDNNNHHLIVKKLSTEVDIFDRLFGLKLRKNELVRTVNYNHSIYEVFLNYGIVFSLAYIVIVLSFCRKFIESSVLLGITFFIMSYSLYQSDIPIISWFVFGFYSMYIRNNSEIIENKNHKKFI